MSSADLGLQEAEVPDKGKHHRKGWIIASIIVALVLIGFLIVFLYALNANNKTSTAQYGDVPADIAELIANPPTFDCPAAVKAAALPMKGDQVILEYIPNAVGGNVKTERAFSDAVNVPAQPTTRNRILASVCSQPEYAGMIGVALATKVEVNGVSLSNLNKEILGQFKNTTPKAWADKVFAGTISYDDATETMTQLAGFMTIFNADKVETRTSTWNLHADKVVYTTKADVRPIILNDKQYTGDFLVFSLTEKGQSECFASFGINVGVGGNTNLGDQRIAGVSCNQPITPKPQQPTPPTTPPTHVTPPPTHNPPPLKSKIPARDPGPRGNAPIGHGPNADPGPGIFQTAPPAQPPATPRVDPPAPAPTPPSSSTTQSVVPTPDPAPAPAPEPSATAPAVPPSTCLPLPGQTTC